MRVSQRQSHGRVKRGWPEWQPVFRDHRRDRMTDRLIEAVPLHHIANSDPPIGHTSYYSLSVAHREDHSPNLYGKHHKNTHIDWINTKKILHVGETYLK